MHSVFFTVTLYNTMARVSRSRRSKRGSRTFGLRRRSKRARVSHSRSYRGNEDDGTSLKLVQRDLKDQKIFTVLVGKQPYRLVVNYFGANGLKFLSHKDKDKTAVKDTLQTLLEPYNVTVKHYEGNRFREQHLFFLESGVQVHPQFYMDRLAENSQNYVKDVFTVGNTEKLTPVCTDA